MQNCKISHWFNFFQNIDMKYKSTAPELQNPSIVCKYLMRFIPFTFFANWKSLYAPIKTWKMGLRASRPLVLHFSCYILHNNQRSLSVTLQVFQMYALFMQYLTLIQTKYCRLTQAIHFALMHIFKKFLHDQFASTTKTVDCDLTKTSSLSLRSTWL